MGQSLTKSMARVRARVRVVSLRMCTKCTIMAVIILFVTGVGVIIIEVVINFDLIINLLPIIRNILRIIMFVIDFLHYFLQYSIIIPPDLP
jgi:hypothetical protein